jgi:DNA mismatch repair protein MutL
MNRIRLLSEQVANQIAAGEVIERPASVVKELVENSLDAGASRISVEILAAGRGLIRVTDDGCGMSRDDALLCLERHATSKISSAADLTRVQTMGFRGEAVPSIASVSRFTLTTCERHAEEETRPGSQIVINGGRIIEVRESGLSPGTSVEVRSLFFNVPARRKFLRSDETERAHIQHWLTTAALAHPAVAFTLKMEGRSVWQLPALPTSEALQDRLLSLQERLRLLLGDGLTPVQVNAEAFLDAPSRAPAVQPDAADEPASEIVKIWGWVGSPGISRATRDDQFAFVNRRPVDNRGLNAAFHEAYHNALMKGRYPVGCLFLEIDPAEVDVNIHPAKREVKFHRERAVRQFVAGAVRDALKAWGDTPAQVTPQRTAPWQPEAAPDLSALTSTPATAPQLRPDPPVPSPAPGPTQCPPGPQRGRDAITPRDPALPAPDTAPDASSFDARAGEPQRRESDHRVFERRQVPAPMPLASTGTVAGGSGLRTPAEPVPLLAIPLRLIGVLGRLYVLLESDRGLVLLDQHAAHERVLYEQMLRRLETEGSAPSQRLLLPESVEVAPKDAAFLRENLSALSRLGVGLSEFGERTFLLDALPPFVKVATPRRFVLELVDELRAAGSMVNACRLGEAVVAKTVCRHAVKANDPLTDPEIEALIIGLRACDMPYTCPHGRPTLIEMSFRELERKFGRIQG